MQVLRLDDIQNSVLIALPCEAGSPQPVRSLVCTLGVSFFVKMAFEGKSSKDNPEFILQYIVSSPILYL